MLEKVQKKISREEAIQKIEHYCAYQERCHKEVNEKLLSFGLYKSDRDEIIVRLIDAGFLNEERFARAFVRGRFNQKKWGRNKIRNELKMRGLKENLIRMAFEEIDEKAYLSCLENLAMKKMKEIKGGNKWEKRQKLFNYLASKGYESELISGVLGND